MKKIKEKIDDLIFEISRVRLKRSATALLFSIFAIISYKTLILSLVCANIAAFFAIITMKENKKVSITSLVLASISIIITIWFYIYSIPLKDPNEGENVIVGTWLYNEMGGEYIFNEDLTYTQYVREDKDDNYCVGRYKYEYGYTYKDGESVLNDIVYDYYTIKIYSDYCIVNGNKEKKNKYDKVLGFGYSKVPSQQNFIINLESENLYYLTKKTQN